MQNSLHCSQASRNCLTTLPATLGQLPNLELLRVAVNDLAELPLPVFHAPKLAWVSLSGNPLCPAAPAPAHAIDDVTLPDLITSDKLGDGASGDVFRVEWRDRTYALKLFKADDASPDGQASDEIAAQLYVDHPALTRVVARVRSPEALVMELVKGAPMAEKPNLQSLLRCRWPAGAAFKFGCVPSPSTSPFCISRYGCGCPVQFTICATLPCWLSRELEFNVVRRWVLQAAMDVATALNYMHKNSLAHGDVYAHNILADDDGNAVLCDYGAAFFYPSAQREHWEPLEVRALRNACQKYVGVHTSGCSVTTECASTVPRHVGEPSAQHQLWRTLWKKVMRLTLRHCRQSQ